MKYLKQSLILGQLTSEADKSDLSGSFLSLWRLLNCCNQINMIKFYFQLWESINILYHNFMILFLNSIIKVWKKVIKNFLLKEWWELFDCLCCSSDSCMSATPWPSSLSRLEEWPPQEAWMCWTSSLRASIRGSRWSWDPRMMFKSTSPSTKNITSDQILKLKAF